MVEVIVNIIIVLLILGFLVAIHELGHFLSAKLFKVKVEAFAIGLGPKFWSKKVGETEYRLNILPLGGYVKILGEGDEELDDKERKDSRNFKNISKWKQIVILLAGVTMNLIFAVGMYYFFIIYSGYKWQLSEDIKGFKPVVGRIVTERLGDVEYTQLTEDGNAKLAGLPDNGVIESVDGNKIHYSNDFREYVTSKNGENVLITVCNPECKDYSVKVSDEGKVGMLIPTNYLVALDYSQDKLIAGFGHSVNLLKLISTRLSDLFSEAQSTGDYSVVTNNISGPIGIYVIVEAFKQYGFLTLLGLTADISFTLAVMNLLPIPALDGGRVLLVVLEKIMGRFWNKKVEMWAINISFMLLLLLMFVIMFKDIIQFDQLRELLR
ncbi:MAG TPA: site-2 protease family protein [Candidatus Dojkabacteria bacterium]|nr:site-2 protease family protein [Candidatus Dojkabacteria bacterium]